MSFTQLSQGAERSFAINVLVRFIRLIISCAMLTSLLTACKNPPAIGVQDYGALVGRVYDARTNQPLNNVVVGVGSLVTAHSDPDGSFTLTHVPTGEQTLTIYPPPAYLPPTPVTVEVQKDQTTTVPPVGLAPAS